MGEKAMQVYLEPLDKIKSTKIVEAYQAILTGASSAEPAKVSFEQCVRQQCCAYS